MASTKKNTAKVISVDAVEETQPVVSTEVAVHDPNQKKLPFKDAKPTRLRINTIQARALAKETVQLIQREFQARKDAMKHDVAFIEAQRVFMETDPLVLGLKKLKKAEEEMNFLNGLINKHNEESFKEKVLNQNSHMRYYWNKPYDVSSLSDSGIFSKLNKIRDNFFYKYYAKELAELSSVTLDEETIYRRYIVKTIGFKETISMGSFQREAIAELAPAIVRIVPTLDPKNYTEEV